MEMATLVNQFGITQFVINKNTEGLTHEDSLLQPSPGGNCLNWVIGHIVKARNDALALVGKDPLYPPERFARYHSRPLTGAEEALPLDELLESFHSLQGPLTAGLKEMTAEQLAAPAPFSPTGNADETVGSLLAGLAFHESYHAGQTGILRRIAGKPGALSAPGK